MQIDLRGFHFTKSMSSRRSYKILGEVRFHVCPEFEAGTIQRATWDTAKDYIDQVFDDSYFSHYVWNKSKKFLEL